jgi:hypothetical protein
VLCGAKSVAKKAKVSAKAPVVLGMPAMGAPSFGPFAQAFGFAQAATALEPRKIVKAKQRSSEFVLDDGTTLTIRPALIDVKRAKDQWGADGKPLYIMTLTNLTDTDSPPRLLDRRLINIAKKKKRKPRS